MKTILLTGATDGIGFETAKMLAEGGHRLLLHGRNPAKLASTEKAVSEIPGAGPVETYVADLSRMEDVEDFAAAVSKRHSSLDVLINNAGIYKTAQPRTEAGLDVRFAVNTLAPWLLTKRLLPLMSTDGRVVNLSSAAQGAVSLGALAGEGRISDMEAYSQSKLAITMWTRALADKLGADGPMVVAVNPASLLGSKMVKEGFGVAGGDLRIGADILCRAALSEEFANASGRYFDNDSGRFSQPHPDAENPAKNAALVAAMETVLDRLA